jgi:hypothetical protein
MESVSLYSEARNEYLKQLATWIIPPLVEFFRTNYLEIAAKNRREVMRLFQNWCSEIPRWNQDIIDSNIENLLSSCKCDYIEDLVTAVFIAHTKMLTAIRVSSKQKKLKITLPKLDHFLHRVFVECARAFWKAPFLFSEDLSPVEKQKNVLQAEAMCTEALSSAVRSLLPIKSILRDYLEEDEEEVDEQEPVKKSAKSKHSKQVDSDSSDSESDSDDEEVAVENIPLIKESDPVAPTVVPVVAAPVAVAPEPAPVAPIPTILAVQTIPTPQPSVAAPTPQLSVAAPTIEPIEFNSDEKIFAKPEVAPLTEKISETPVLEKIPASQELFIETEPSVHFSPYETVFDENKPNVSEIRYAPKMSIEELPDSDWFDGPPPRIQVNSDAKGLDADDIEDLDPPKSESKVDSVELDIDAPLDSTGDFEELS